ncbi:hypothetical protein [Rhizobium rosettiformans]|uniref:hypothetical protein n=1 Tax=Rhizobium rosettiformans TaxID=1368430 RepID=UPI00285ADA3D|nr:hypothetical protein [Rhizobium rosettiformans]MDR7029837.1 hypothetical protein [Rhizobium rosettiformans]MDR7063551.1 hypothetical protein [Rhizobium rosettiformans]
MRTVILELAPRSELPHEAQATVLAMIGNMILKRLISVFAALGFSIPMAIVALTVRLSCRWTRDLMVKARWQGQQPR